MKDKEIPYDHNFGSFVSFIEEFMKETDRAAVILGVAKLELLLYQILNKIFIASSTTKDDLLDAERPLGTFSSKIHILYRLGFIDNGISHCLHMIRKIRNDFAHETANCALNTGSHRDRVKELIVPFKNLESFKQLCEVHKKDHVGAALEFRIALGMLTLQLETLYENCKLPKTTEQLSVEILINTDKMFIKESS